MEKGESVSQSASQSLAAGSNETHSGFPLTILCLVTLTDIHMLTQFVRRR